MENKSPLKNALFALLGPIFLFPTIISWVFWFGAFSANPDKTQAEKVAIFLGHFPSFIQSLNLINIITVTSSVIALVISIISTINSGKILEKKDRLIFKGFGVITIIISALMTFMNLFQLM
jgi:hypothetical protein